MPASAAPSPTRTPPRTRSLAISVDPDSINSALSQLDRPLLAIGELNLQAAMNHLDIGAVQLHGLRLEIGPEAPASEPASEPDGDDQDNATGSTSGANTASGTGPAGGSRSQP